MDYSSNTPPSPIPLVIETDGFYKCEAAGLKFLQSCKGPVSVVIVAGRYRTGKSFLLNRGVLGLPPRGGFTTGSTVNACTKGIWAYPEILQWEGQDFTSTRSVLVLDTEGTGSTEASPGQDAKLISIAVSLASLFVYNSSGALDEASFSEIGLVAHATRSLEQHSGTAWNAPALLWVLRDFSLLLRSADGSQEISADAYLERCLQETDKGEARALVRAYFEKRSLFTLVRPVTDEALLRNVNDLEAGDLRPEFVEQLRGFHNAVRAAPVKLIGGREATGAVVAHMCECATRAVNEGGVPCVRDSLTFLLERDIAKFLKEAASEIAEASHSLSLQLPLPPTSVRIPRPSVPPSLAAHAPSSGDFVSEVEKMCRAEEETLEQQNGKEQARWVREFLESARSSDAPLRTLGEFVRSAHKSVGAICAHDAALLVYEACTDSHSKQMEKLEQNVARAQNAEAACIQDMRESRLESEELRMELEEALTSSLKISYEEDSQSLRDERLHSQALASELTDTMCEVNTITRQREAISCEWEASKHDNEHQRHETAQNMRRREQDEIFQLKECRTEIQSLQREIEVRDREEKGRLEATQEEMLQAVEEAHSVFLERHESTVAECERGRDEIAALDERTTKAEECISQERSAAQGVRSQFKKAEAEHTASLVQQKRKHTESMAEKSTMMRETHEGILLELQRTREKAAESDRLRVRLEIENETHKRSCSSHHDDIQQLAKTRRYAEDMREQLSDRDAVARSSTALLEESRRRIGELEDHLRKTEASHSSEMRNKDYRIALLEVQLQAFKKTN